MGHSSRALPLFLVGLFLLLLGATWTSVESRALLPRLVLAAGGLLLVIFLIRHGPEIRFLLLHVRSHSEPGPTTTILLAALVLGLAGLVSANRVPFLDLTPEGINSLSKPSRAALQMLRDPLRLDGFFVEGSLEWGTARRYLGVYERSCPRVRVSLQDPDRMPAAAREARVTRSGVIVISYRKAQTHVLRLTEEAITQGILRVLEGRRRRVGLLQGHGEPGPDSGGETGLTGWVKALADANIESRGVSLLTEGAVPGDIDALLIVHPRQPLYDSEVKRIREFLARGGGLGLWVEPGDSTGLETLLQFNSVRLLPGTIRDRGPVTERLGLGPWTPALAANPMHEIGAEMAGAFVAAPGVRPLEIVSPHPIDLIIDPVLKTARTAEVLPGPGPEEEEPIAEGIQVTGVALEWETAVGESWRPEPDSLGFPPAKPKARILVVGDASLITNRYLGIGANRIMAINSVHWLTWQERFLGIGRQMRGSSKLKIGRRGLRTLLYVVQIGLPVAMVALGLGVWFRRRARS